MPITADQIRKIREEFGWTQTDLSKRLGVAMNSVSRWELGQPVSELAAVAIRCVADRERLRRRSGDASVGKRSKTTQRGTGHE